jgi:hypothetical protein
MADEPPSLADDIAQIEALQGSKSSLNTNVDADNLKPACITAGREVVNPSLKKGFLNGGLTAGERTAKPKRLQTKVITHVTNSTVGGEQKWVRCSRPHSCC